jgi:Fe-Mn family superoxide dismutase
MLHLDRRQLLRAAGAGVASLALAPWLAQAAEEKQEAPGFKLPPLPYDYGALEPHIDAETMKIHHDKHHQAYVNNLNTALKNQPDLLKMSVKELLKNIDNVPKDLRGAVVNQGGGHSNHSIFWTIMGPNGGGQPGGALAKAIDDAFGSFDKFQMRFSTAAKTLFGSGWVWLVVGSDGKLEAGPRPNQNSPYMENKTPLLGIDVWEHAYYLKYRNERPKYVDAWWKVINWKAVEERFAAAKG